MCVRVCARMCACGHACVFSSQGYEYNKWVQYTVLGCTRCSEHGHTATLRRCAVIDLLNQIKNVSISSKTMSINQCVFDY